MAYLLIIEPGKKPHRQELAGSTTIGRAWDCDICVHDDALSRRHCCVEPADRMRTEWAVVDLGSRNGTKVIILDPWL